jgi:outer membrane protein TolC
MKSLITSLLLILVTYGAWAQNQPVDASTFNMRTDSLAEHLVSLAMNNPRIQYQANLAAQFNELYKKSKTAWLSAIIIQGNLNEYSINESAEAKAANLFPRYNFGVNIPLSIFTGSVHQTRSDFYKSQAMADQVEVERRTVRKEVLVAYETYVTDKRLLVLEEQVVSDWHIIFLRTEERFRKGEVTLESFYSSTRIYNDELNKEVQLTGTIASSAAELEELIGMNLEDAIQMYNDQKRNGK